VSAADRFAIRVFSDLSADRANDKQRKGEG